jgi:hypothetical protein
MKMKEEYSINGLRTNESKEEVEIGEYLKLKMEL